VGQVLGDKLTGQLDKKMSARAVQFRNRLTSLGPTFIKVGLKTPAHNSAMPASVLGI
jgi:predicted unusual protein kinase regulating ubiquinone biosynthesis (AarF/ABC1/UbiB family)